MKKFVFIILALFVLGCGAAFAQNVAQDGNAIMCEAGFFPDRGYYGASDTFAVGSIVKVTNKANNKSVEVYMVEKADSFLTLSYDAAFKIGLKRKGSAAVTVEVVRSGSMVKSDKVVDSTPKPDKITPVAKKSYPLLPDGVESPKEAEPAPVQEKSAPAPVQTTPEPAPAATAPAPIAPAQESEAEFEVVKDKVVAVIIAEDANAFATKYVSSNTTGKSLPKPAGTFYVQLGFFSSLDNAEQVAYTVETDLPVLIVCKEMETYMGYRVLAGPAELSEKADVLSEFRDSGFPDAFASVNE